MLNAAFALEIIDVISRVHIASFPSTLTLVNGNDYYYNILTTDVNIFIAMFRAT